MTQQQLDRTYVGARFQQMDGEGVPQGMRCDRFANTATPPRLLAGLLYGGPADMIIDLIAWEEPPLRSVHSPPVALPKFTGETWQRQHKEMAQGRESLRTWNCT
jgi:hypothetical protein